MQRSFLHISLLLGFITIAAHSNACICIDRKTLEEQILEHAFIAHVRIVEKIHYKDTVRTGQLVQVKNTHQGDLKFEILELFKGDSLSTIKQYDISTSCDIGIYPGEEWILFVWYNPDTRIYSVGGCSPSRKYRNEKGERNWRWGLGESFINRLREHFRHPVPAHPNGEFISYYANGRPEHKAYYINNQLCGERRIYYANGILNVYENYSEGKLDGAYRFFSTTGQLLVESNYVKGKTISSKEWADTTRRHLFAADFLELRNKKEKDIKVVIWLLSEYNVIDSISGIFRGYDINGKLKGETFTNDRDSISIHKSFFPSGEIKFMSTNFMKEKKVVFQEWDEKGRLKFDQTRINGIIVEDRLKKNKEP